MRVEVSQPTWILGTLQVETQDREEELRQKSNESKIIEIEKAIERDLVMQREILRGRYVLVMRGGGMEYLGAGQGCQIAS